MTAARKVDIKNRLLSGATALGNSGRGLKEVCSDLLNDANKRGMKVKALCDGTFLCPATIERMMKLDDTEEGAPYRPNADTCERILRFFGAEMVFNEVTISNKFANKPKAEI